MRSRWRRRTYSASAAFTACRLVLKWPSLTASAINLSLNFKFVGIGYFSRHTGMCQNANSVNGHRLVQNNHSFRRLAQRNSEIKLSILLLGPGVAQGNGAVENELAGLGILW